MLLAGDIGGTKTTLGLFSPADGPRRPLARATFASGEFGGLEEIIEVFLHDAPAPPGAAVFGIAGPVRDSTVRTTNLPWTVDTRELEHRFAIPRVHLLNDLEAIATAVPLLGDNDLSILNRGRPDPRGARAVVAPGTGLGQAWLVREDATWRAHPSEGGHVDFAPRSELEAALLSFLRQRHEHVSYERVCSGRGILELFIFMRDTGRIKVPGALAAAMAEEQDPVPVIVRAALAGEPPPCRPVLDLFIDILAAQAGNYALSVLATGGVYLAGGIPPRVAAAIDAKHFMNIFSHKGRLQATLEQIPVAIVTAEDIALTGAAACGLSRPGG